jgi:hypothetical protein
MARAQGYVSANPVAALDRDERPAPEADLRPVQVLDEAQVARLLEHVPVRAHVGTRGRDRSPLERTPGPDLGRSRPRPPADRGQSSDRHRRHRPADRDQGPGAVRVQDRPPDRRPDGQAARPTGDPGRARPRRPPGRFRVRRRSARPARYARYGLPEGGRRCRDRAAPDRRLSPHSLRHGYGSLFLARGEQVSNVSAWLGHRKISTTERWYAHQIESMLDVAAERMRQRERERVNA